MLAHPNPIVSAELIEDNLPEFIASHPKALELVTKILHREAIELYDTPGNCFVNDYLWAAENPAFEIGEVLNTIYPSLNIFDHYTGAVLTRYVWDSFNFSTLPNTYLTALETIGLVRNIARRTLLTYEEAHPTKS